MANNERKRGLFFPSSGGSKSLLRGGGGFFLFFIAVIIGGGFLLTGNSIFPQNQLTEPDAGVYQIDEESLKDLEEERGNLQLKTFKFKECKAQASATLFVDRSGSMRGQKLSSLKDALNGFISQMGDESVTGLISYSTNVTEDVAIDLFANNKDRMSSAISSLVANGGTRTRNAFNFALSRITSAKDRYPDKQHVIVFLSDGIPEAASDLTKTCTAPACSPGNNRCFETTEDPTNTAFGPDISQQIKDAGIRIFAITLYDSSDTCFQNDLKAMMQKVASPDSYYETPNPEDLQKIYAEISTKICQAAGVGNN